MLFTHIFGMRTKIQSSYTSKEDRAESVFVNVYGAQETIMRNRFRQPISLAGRYDKGKAVNREDKRSRR